MHRGIIYGKLNIPYDNYLWIYVMGQNGIISQFGHVINP